MLNTIFNDNEVIEIRCLHKDQKQISPGRYEPEPHMYWGNIKDVKKLYKQLKELNNKGYNIYYGANPRPEPRLKFATKANALFVDLDHCSLDEANRQLKLVMDDWMVPNPSLCVMSGNGVHFYWRLKHSISIKEFTDAQKALIHTFLLYGDVVDKAVHDGPRIMRLPGFINHKGGNIADIIGEVQSYDRYDYSEFLFCFANLPEEKITPAKVDQDYKGQNENALARALKYFELRNGAGKGERNNEAFKISAACLNDFGLSDQDCYHVISTWNLKNNPPLSENEVRTVIAKARKFTGDNPTCSKDRPKPKPKTNHVNQNEDPGDFVPEVETQIEPEPAKPANFDMAIVSYMVNNYVLIAGTTDVWDLENGILMPLSALSALYPKEVKYWKHDYNRKTILTKNLVFEPSGKVSAGQINTFRGFNFEKDERPCPRIMSHLEMLCGDDPKIFEWVLSWCALQVQKPGTKLATSIIMHGKQGTGKSLFWECFGKIFDPYFIKINQTLLESDFNSWASRKTFILCEEVLANRQKSRLKNVIKDMVTGESIEINQKFSRPWSEKCYMNMVFLSNNKLPMILDEDDRRFLVIKTDNVQNEEYYSKLAEEIQDNGPARLYSYLMDWDLQGFHAHTKPATTLAKADLIELTKPSCKIFLDNWLSGEIEDLPVLNAFKADLYDAYSIYCKASGYRASTRTTFYKTIDSDYPTLVLKRTASHRYYKMESDNNINPTQFNEALMKYVNKVFSRKV